MFLLLDIFLVIYIFWSFCNIFCDIIIIIIIKPLFSFSFYYLFLSFLNRFHGIRFSCRGAGSIQFFMCFFFFFLIFIIAMVFFSLLFLFFFFIFFFLLLLWCAQFNTHYKYLTLSKELVLGLLPFVKFVSLIDTSKRARLMTCSFCEVVVF